jgi:hypothetical protein
MNGFYSKEKLPLHLQTIESQASYVKHREK